MIKVQVNIGEIQKRLNYFRLQLRDTRPLMREVADIMLDSTMENFKQGGRPKWLESQAAKDRSGQTLINKGAHGGLLGSIHKAYGRNYSMVGTNKVYAAIHHFGGLIRRKQVASIDDFRPFDGRPTKLRSYAVGELPARPYFKLQEDELKDIELTAVKYLGDKK